MHITRATADESIQRDVLTYNSWGAPLTQEQFLLREKTLRATPWTQANMTTWLLRNNEGEVLSSCETFRMNSRLREETGHAYGIASVYTENKYRGQGYAGQLISKTIEVLRAEDPRLQAFHLYSEVGAAIYERVGFSLKPSRVLTAPAQMQTPGLQVTTFHRSEDAVLTAMLSSYHALPLEFHILVSAEQLNWHWERERIYQNILHKPAPAFHMTRCGESFAAWTADYKNNEFLALLFVGQTGSEASALVRSAQSECHRLGLEQVVIWDSSAAGTTGLLKHNAVTIQGRSDSLAMISPNLNWQEIPRAVWV